MTKAPTKFGSFQELLDVAAEPMRPVLSQLRAIILKIDPNAYEVVRLGESSRASPAGSWLLPGVLRSLGW